MGVLDGTSADVPSVGLKMMSALFQNDVEGRGEKREKNGGENYEYWEQKEKKLSKVNNE